MKVLIACEESQEVCKAFRDAVKKMLKEPETVQIGLEGVV